MACCGVSSPLAGNSAPATDVASQRQRLHHRRMTDVAARGPADTIRAVSRPECGISQFESARGGLFAVVGGLRGLCNNSDRLHGFRLTLKVNSRPCWSHTECSVDCLVGLKVNCFSEQGSISWLKRRRLALPSASLLSALSSAACRVVLSTFGLCCRS